MKKKNKSINIEIKKPKAGPTNFREVIFKDIPIKTPVFLRKEILPGEEIRGPAIIEQLDSTTVIFPSQKGRTDPFGNIIVENIGG